MTRTTRSLLRRSLAATALLASCLVARGPARAEPANDGKVMLAVDACQELFEAELRRILRIELGDLLDESPLDPTSGRERIEIRCETELARISARAGNEVVDHDLRFDAFPGDAAPRAVALASLEALRAVDPTLTERIEAQAAKAPPAKPHPAPPAPPPEKSHPSAPSTPKRAWTRVLLGAVARGFPSDPETMAWGGRLELSRRLAIPLDLGFDLDGTFARRSVELGQVDATLFSAAAWVGPRVGGPSWSASFGLAGRFGLADLRGGPEDAAIDSHRATRFWGGPALVARADGAVGIVALALALESGFAVASAEGLAGGVPAIGAHAAWLSASLSSGIRF